MMRLLRDMLLLHRQSDPIRDPSFCAVESIASARKPA